MVERLRAIGQDEFRLVVEASPSGMLMVDREGTIVLVNAQVEKLFGYVREELIGNSIEVLVPHRFRSEHPKHREGFFGDLQVRAMGAGRDLYGVCKDGSEIPVEIGLNPIVTSAGQFVLASIVDITERKRAEQQLRLVIEASPSGMIMVDRQGTIVLVNAQVERLFGYGRDELIGQKIDQLVPDRFRNYHPQHREEFFADATARSMGAGRELYGLRKDGTEVPVEIGLNPLKTELGDFVLASVVDITERHKVQEELLKAKTELEHRVQERTKQLAEASDQAHAASRLKSEFLANMSHEIRTPMNAIIGMCNVLLRTGLQPRQQEYAGHIREGANALLNVINDILDFSKIEAGRLELEIVDFNLVKLVEGTCELLAASARAKQLSLMAYVDPHLPEQLQGDPERIRQVLLNLTANAIKFSERGEIAVRADLASEENKIIRVKFSVIDNGIGLSASEQSRLFQPFVQADGSISRRFGGSGLGLSISKRLVDLMSGTINVDSEAGQGSTFWFTLPLERRSDSVEATLRKELQDVRILIIDDEPHARQILHDYVLSWGMRNGVAVNAKGGLKALRQAYVDADPYKVALIDYVMPEKNGMDLAKEIINDPAIKSTKVILLTAYDAPGFGLQAVELGINAYLTKPVRQSQMLECIMNVLAGDTAIGRSSADARMAVRELNATRDELILVAEDYAINQQVAQLYLDELGFTCHVVSNGAEAVEAMNTANYALVLMDCQMPEMDGYAATAAIRKAQEALGRRTPIVAMTAHAMGGDRERCLAAGMDDYISKPVDPEELRTVLNKWIPLPPPDAELRSETIDELRKKYGESADGLCRMFLEKSPKEIESLKVCLEQHDKNSIGFKVHGLKGICATIGAQQMRSTCAELEASIANEDWENIAELIARLEEESKVAITAFLSQGLQP